ncbi:MAG: hypothetical protein ACT4TC_04150 [Myxococcaceae bacterium]
MTAHFLRRSAALAGLCAALALSRCAPRVPQQPVPPVPAPLGAQVPPGCERDLSGDYVHAENQTFRYRGGDDGRTLTLEMDRVFPEADGGHGTPSPVVRLTRTPEGFVGGTHARVYDPRGTLCPVEFQTSVLVCDAQGLLLRTEVNTSVDEACRPPPTRSAGQMTEQRLLRAQSAPRPSASDAGAP